MAPVSLTAVRQVIDWAHEQGMTIRELLDEQQLERLKRVFSKQEPWSFDLYEPLRALSHALPRLDLPDLPVRIHFGDCLSALDAILARDAASGAGEGAYAEGLQRYSWPLDHALPSDVFETLGYAKASAGISALRAKHRSGWQQHAERNKAFLLRGAAETAGGSAAVIGAGKLYDIPLKQLAERFERLLLIDVDGAALTESVEQVLGDSSPRDRVELVTSDVTGINASFVRRVDEIFAVVSDAQTTLQELLALLYSLRSAGAASLAPQAQLPLPLKLTEATSSASDAWPWQRLVPTATRPHGRRLSVNGCVVCTRAVPA